MGEVKPLTGIGIDELYLAWEDAFQDYPVQISKEDLESMLFRRSYNAALSFGYFDEGKLVSFILNGIGDYNQLKTAYDSGTGTIKSHQKRGLATALFNASIPYLKQAGVQQYLLEVLKQNEAAISVYKKLGFEVSRVFDYYFIYNQDVAKKEVALPQGFEFREIEMSALNGLDYMHDFAPSWQNSTVALNRKTDGFTGLGVFSGDTIVGYGVIEPERGDLSQMAIAKPYRQKGIGTVLFYKLLTLSKHERVKVLNCDNSCTSVSGFFAHHNIEVKGQQFEMIKHFS